MYEIASVTAREILDSRANPTVEATVTLCDGTAASASVPSGASTGAHEAAELRDTENDTRYRGKGVLRAVSNVRERIAPAIVGVPATEQGRVDSLMIALDGEYNKSNCGANAILSVSLAAARAAATAARAPLYRYLGGALREHMPVPMMNILNGGAHTTEGTDFQEFMIIPTGADSFSEAVRMGAEVYAALKDKLRERGLPTGVGDEGGFSPGLSDERAAIELILSAVSAAGYSAGRDIMLGLDMAASEWVCDGGYLLPRSGRRYTSTELCMLIEELVRDYPILTVEDGMGEEDTEGWRLLTSRLGERVTLVGDDLFVTDPRRVAAGIEKKTANAVLIKPNQIGTLTETAAAVNVARRAGWRTVMSHRSGETADSFISDLAVALGTDFIKCGAPARSERTAKYNRLMAIESEMFAPSYGL